jgi:hypothetical protein
MNCLTAAAAPQSGAFNFDSDAEKAAMSARLFPPSDWTLSNQYRDAYTMSAGLTGNVKQREAQANAQCEGRLGALQGPLGEVYSTHTTISGMTWRYVIGVQLSANYTVTTHDLAMDSAGTSAASYRCDHAAPGFKPLRAADLWKVVGTTVLELQESANELCDTAPECVTRQPHCSPHTMIIWSALAQMMRLPMACMIFIVQVGDQDALFSI